MINTDFHNICGPYSVKVLSKLINAKVYNADNKSLISGAADVDNAKKGDITFIAFNNTLGKLLDSKASACIVSKYHESIIPNKMVCLEVNNPHESYAIIAQKFYPINDFIPKVSLKSDVPDKYRLSKNIRIDPYVVIEEGAIIGDNVWIGSGSYIGRGVIIGNGTRIHSNVTVECAEIGENVLLYTGVRIGQSGFGFAPTAHGHVVIPQVGKVIIHKNVEIGANSCIDRGSYGPTVIGEGTFIDNLVHIAHNVKIGKFCAIAGQVGIAGSTTIEDYCMFGGQVGIGGHIKIGKGSQAGGQAGITKDLIEGSKVSGTPAIPLTQYHRQSLLLKKLIINKGK
jgi:UDP-3-O-[3-hydroxymyristoyl] glucosamine N-acyltransferase